MHWSQAAGLVKARGKQRTDSTHVVAAIRVLNRVELVGETLRAALNEIAVLAPDWVRTIAPLAWYERYQRRSEDGRLPKGKEACEVYARTVGEDGFWLLDALDAAETPPALREVASIKTLRRVWQQQGKTAEARALLAPVYNWFTEGFDTKDLQEARAVLDQLV